MVTYNEKKMKERWPVQREPIVERQIAITEMRKGLRWVAVMGERGSGEQFRHWTTVSEASRALLLENLNGLAGMYYGRCDNTWFGIRVDGHSRVLQVDAAREARTPCMQPLTEPHAGQSDLLLTAGAGMPSVSQRQRYKNRNPTTLITCKCSSIVAPP